MQQRAKAEGRAVAICILGVFTETCQK